ncbi:hypothetical protein PR202_gb17785 [Eleusine coracana subsp. coracana]|uniref:AP-1 complex subunit gamma n=1 Tax=Eleusine coracana subsp. coracana TaxID=191504 RepID=A0AAV5F382_ELECO|nr:hypothetical protein PR202_gb17785 [Eleusine coracana subsp. coracana]
MLHRDMIRSIRACKTAAEERAVVRRECAAIRAAISEGDQDYRHRNMAKLMFIHMLGYPTHFGQMECLKLIAAAGFPEKRIGYLGLMLLLDERQEVLMLVTNSLKQDLNHSNQFIVGLALCALGNICSAEMARDLAPEVERLLQNRDPNTKKKAALCCIRIVRKVPDLAENFMGSAVSLLKEKHHGVLISAVQLCTELCKSSNEASEYLRKNCLESLVRILRDVSNSSYAPEYDIAGITDPFLHIRVLKLMRTLAQGDADCSEYINDILAQAIAVDAQAVQRHRATILECVKDADVSIRRRALELLYLLVNDTNVKSLTKELVDYLEVSDQDFKEDLTAKICSIVEKFSQDKLWYLDQMFRVLSLAGNYVKDDVWHALIVLMSNASELQGYSVRSLYKALQVCGEQESLVRVAVWCIGEYGEMLVNNINMLDMEEPITVTESDAVDAVELSLKRYSADVTTRAMCLVSLLKLSSRFPPTSERIKEIVAQNKGNTVLELQQRSIEFSSIIQRHQSIKSSLLERMPVLDEANYLVKRAASTQATISSVKPTAVASGDPPKLPNGVSKPPPAPLADLLDLSSDDAQVTTSTPAAAPNDFLQDLLGIGLVDSSPAAETKPAPVMPQVVDLLDGLSSSASLPDENAAYPTITAFQSATLKITFSFKKQPGKPQETAINASFTNLTTTTFTDFIFQAAVPKFIQLRLDPASSSTLPASGNGSVTQSLSVTNNQHGQKPLAMRIRMSYKVNGEDRLEQGQISNFPAGL